MIKRKSLMLAAAVLAAAPAALLAGPYASYIRVDMTPGNIVPSGTGTDITYVLNDDADSVLVEILDNLNAPVASFDGLTSQGLNVLAWDGTINNQNGTAVADGDDYRVRITVDAARAAQWYTFSDIGTDYGVLNSPPPPTFIGLNSALYPKAAIIKEDTDSDYFGTVLVTAGLASANVGGFVVLNTALRTVAGDDGLASRVMRHPRELTNNVGSYSTWGAKWERNSDTVWVTGQSTGGVNALLRADNSTGLVDVMSDNSGTWATVLPRDVAVHDYGTRKIAVLAHSNAGQIGAIQLGPGDAPTTVTTNIAFSSGRYSKAVIFDENGNLYHSQRGTGTGATGGVIYRWSPAAVLAAVDDPIGAPLADTNADWVISMEPLTNANVLAVAITPAGDVYTLNRNTAIYHVGNISTPTLVKTLAPADRVVDLTQVNPNGALNVLGSASYLTSDLFGNLYLVDGQSESIYGISLGGTTSHTVTAPVSQTFSIGAIARVEEWMMLQ